jgi:predicted DNA repair protein MutK
MTQRRNSTTQAIGRGLVHGVPYLLTGLSGIGTAAMLWVGGGIILHGMEQMHFETIPHALHEGAHAIAETVGVAKGVVEWLANAIAASIGGLIVGGVIVGLMHLRPKRAEAADSACPEEIV